MKRLLCILSSLDTGGAETFLMKIFRNLSDEYKLDFVVSSEIGYYEDEVIKLGGIIHRVPLRTKHPVRTLNMIRKIVKENNYKYILKLSDTPIAVFDLISAKLGGAVKTSVRSCNASSTDSHIRNTINFILRPVFNLVSDVKIAPSKLAAEYTFGVNAVTKGKVHFLKNGIDIDAFRYSSDNRAAIRQEFNMEKEFVVGHIGRFNNQKNHKFLISIFNCLQNKCPNVKLLLVGKGELERDIHNMVEDKGIQNKVVFAGVRSDIPNLLSGIDLFVFPSFYEGMPNTIIEAQATGLQCVISDTITKEADITGLVEYVSLEKSPEYWADICIDKLNNPSERISPVDCFVKSGYDIKDVTKKFIELLF